MVEDILYSVVLVQNVVFKVWCIVCSVVYVDFGIQEEH